MVVVVRSVRLQTVKPLVALFIVPTPLVPAAPVSVTWLEIRVVIVPALPVADTPVVVVGVIVCGCSTTYCTAFDTDSDALGELRTTFWVNLETAIDALGVVRTSY